MTDMERIIAAAHAWLAFIGDLDYSPVIVPFGDPDGAEQKARYELARVLRAELFEPERHGPLSVWSGEVPLRGKHQHWGGTDIWRCDEHPEWEGEEYGTWDTYRDFIMGDEKSEPRPESVRRQEWEANSVEAHAATHGVVLG